MTMYDIGGEKLIPSSLDVDGPSSLRVANAEFGLQFETKIASKYFNGKKGLDVISCFSFQVRVTEDFKAIDREAKDKLFELKDMSNLDCTTGSDCCM